MRERIILERADAQQLIEFLQAVAQIDESNGGVMVDCSEAEDHVRLLTDKLMARIP